MTLPFRASDAGCLLDIRLQPGASQNRIEGVVADGEGCLRLKIKVTAVPEKGRANSLLIKLLSKSMKRPQRDFEIVSGRQDRNKTMLIIGDQRQTRQDLEIWIKTI